MADGQSWYKKKKWFYHRCYTHFQWSAENRNRTSAAFCRQIFILFKHLPLRPPISQTSHADLIRAADVHCCDAEATSNARLIVHMLSVVVLLLQHIWQEGSGALIIFGIAEITFGLCVCCRRWLLVPLSTSPSVFVCYLPRNITPAMQKLWIRYLYSHDGHAQCLIGADSICTNTFAATGNAKKMHKVAKYNSMN